MSDSELIQSHTYDPDTLRLTLTFHKGPTAVDYHGVEPAKYAEFLDAPSQGKFFHQRIRDRHSWTKGV